MSHYGDGIKSWYDENEKLLYEYRLNNKPRIRCSSFNYLIFKNKRKSDMNHAQHQANNLEAACDMALALR